MSVLADYPQALAAALNAVNDRVRARGRIEECTLSAAFGRVLAEPVIADRDLPPFNRAMMDGYSLRAAEYERGRAFAVVGAVPAGASSEAPVPSGSCVRIATGAPLPADCDAVIQHEVSDRGDPVRFTLDRVEPGNAVHSRGADAKQGDTLIPAGTTLASQHLGIAASVGATSVVARTRPRAIVLTSGDEVTPFDRATASLRPHQIRNSNGIMVGALLDRFGALPIATEHVADDKPATIAAVASSLAMCDLLITVGGVSAGERDHFPAAFDAAGVERTLVGAAIQPGRPIVVGRSPEGMLVIALPGNPVSALACACLFVWPLVRSLLGLSATLPWRDVEIAKSVQPNAHRRAFRPAALHADGRIVVPAWAGSGDLAHTASTNGLVELPVQSEAVPAGARLRFLPWP